MIMNTKPFNHRTALTLAVGISLLLNLLFLIMFFYGRDAVLPPDGSRPRQIFSALPMAVHVISNFLLAYVLYILNFKLLNVNMNSKIKLTVIILSTFFATLLLSYVFSYIQISLSDMGPHPKHFIRGGMFRDSFIAIIVLFSSQLMYLSNKQQKTALENKTLMSENIRTRYEALKNQVDPHFLFNSLNTLNSLIKTDADKAQEYVQQLSFVFRYTLQNKEIISLKEELNFTEAYCKLMQIRYGESLRFRVGIDKKYNDYFIMPLSLQTLVENAIKHNIVSNKQPLSIDITGREDFVTVSNPIQPKKESEKGEGIGLINLAERYRLMTQKEIIIRASEGVFSVEVPLVRPD